MQVDAVRVLMATEWRNIVLNDAGPGEAWSGSPLGSSPSYFQICQWHPGETLLRTRLDGQFTAVLQNADPPDDTIGEYVVGANRLLFGVYAKKTVDAATPPADPSETPGDGFWTLRDVMTLHAYQYYASVAGAVEKYVVTYKFSGGVSQSFSQKGPAELENSIWLSWFLYNPFGLVWDINAFPLHGFFSYNIEASVLVRTVP